MFSQAQVQLMSVSACDYSDLAMLLTTKKLEFDSRLDQQQGLWRLHRQCDFERDCFTQQLRKKMLRILLKLILVPSANK